MLGNFVFDIDGTLAIMQGAKQYERDKVIIEEKFGAAFLEQHCIVAADYPHFVFPGFYALFQWIHAQGGKIFFFSAGLEARNVTFAAQIMERAFGENPPAYKVFSRKDCINTHDYYMPDEVRKSYQGFSYGQYKKKMGGIVVPESELPYSLLIDDDHSYMTKGEDYNLVWVEVTDYYLQEEPSKDRSFYKSHLFENLNKFHKAYYLAGLFAKIFEVQTAKNITLVEATKEVQMEGGSFGDGGRWYKSLIRLEYYLEGKKILNQIDPTLDFYYTLPQEDDSDEWE